MGMQHITGTAYEVVMRQGLANAQPVGAGRVRGMQRKGPGAASGGARGGVKADATLREDARHRPTAGQGGDHQPMGNSGKGPGVNGPAKFTVLTCNMAQPAHVRRKQATNAHLRLVWAR